MNHFCSQFQYFFNVTVCFTQHILSISSMWLHVIHNIFSVFSVIDFPLWTSRCGKVRRVVFPAGDTWYTGPCILFCSRLLDSIQWTEQWKALYPLSWELLCRKPYIAKHNAGKVSTVLLLSPDRLQCIVLYFIVNVFQGQGSILQLSRKIKSTFKITF